MFRTPVQTPPKWWSPKLSPFWVRLWRPLRRIRQQKVQRIEEVRVLGMEHLAAATGPDQGVLITPNHPGSGDPDVMYDVADQLGLPFYFMAAWQVFGRASPLVRHFLRQHGVFSVDREGMDRRAFKQAIDVLTSRKHPLVIFPEGEVYHMNDRLTPFREGPAAIALTAAKRAKRPVVVVPAAIKYHFLEDPTPDLDRLMDKLEEEIFWRPRRDLSLAERIYRFAEGALALKELEYTGHTSEGRLPERIAQLSEFILGRLEERHGAPRGGATIPERIKSLRQRTIKKLEALVEDDAQREQFEHDLDDVFLVVQLFSYPGDYVAEAPASIERIAETLDKFEEDVLGASRAAIRAPRRATVALDEPIVVEPDSERRQAGPQLAQLLEERVQALLDQIAAPPERDFGVTAAARRHDA